jgi:hypothetical protein
MTIENHKKFNLEEFLQIFVESAKGMFIVLIPSYSKKLWKFVFDNFTALYG